MALHFSRLKSEMSYFENADTLSIESFLDLMFDLYSDVEEGIGIGPEKCGSDDSEALAENLIWMGTVFRNICRLYGKEISTSGRSNQTRLTGIREELEREIRALEERKNSYEKAKDRVVVLQKEKRTLEGELSQFREKQPELKTLENRVAQMRKEKAKAEADWKTNQDSCATLEKEIRETTEEIGRMEDQIQNELSPQMKALNVTLSERQSELKSLNSKIQSGDEQSEALKLQIEKLQRDIESSDKEGILQRLQEQKTALEKEKKDLESLDQKIGEYQKEILRIQEDQQEKRGQLSKKRREKETLQQDLNQLDEAFKGLCSSQTQYNKLKRRYNSLKTISDQLRKDSTILCKRTGMEEFSLADDLERGMNAVGAYLSGVAAAIDQYSRQAEDSL